MNTYVFNLDEYFEHTQKYYYFFDGLIAKSKRLKKDVLKDVDIYDVSYRSDRLKLKVKNNNRKILLDYFGYNAVDKESKLKYEICISKIYYCTYYLKLDVLKDLLEELDTYIEENNYLKPLFILFKIFGTMASCDLFIDLNKKFKEEIKYLSSFIKCNYFTKEIGYLYCIVMLFFGVDTNLERLDEFSNIYKELTWYDYTIRANYYYMNKKDSDSLMYFNAALDEFKEAYNIERLLRTTNNICAIYNLLNKYQFSLNVSEKVIKYAFCQEPSLWIKLIAMHYLFSNYMLKRYNEVIEFYNVIVLNEKFLSEISILIIILSAFKANKMNQVESLIEKNKESKNINLFLKAIESISANSKNDLDLSSIDNTNYLIKLAETLKN